MSPPVGAVPVEPIFEFLGEQEREKRSKRHGREWPCPSVVDRTGGEDAVGLAQQLLDALRVAVAQHHLQRDDLAIGPQQVKAMDPG
jgi:hypothetical protein